MKKLSQELVKKLYSLLINLDKNIQREELLRVVELIRAINEQLYEEEKDLIMRINEEKEFLLRERRGLIEISRNLEKIAEQRIENTSGPIFECITGVGNPQNDVKSIEKWLLNVEDLIIADPYFFSYSKSVYRTERDYSNKLVDILPNKLKSLEVYHLPAPNARIKRKVEKHCYSNNIRFKHYPTTRIHDRVWIKNQKEAKLIGTSFGGLGNKIAFIVDLPKGDLEAFLKELFKIKNNNLSDIKINYAK